MRKNKNLLKTSVVSLVVASTLFITTSTYAKDCNVKFLFINKWKAKTGQQCDIRIKKINIVGDKGAWYEKINNRKMPFKSALSTKKHLLNKLTDGGKGRFTIHFDQRCKDGAPWISKKRQYPTLTCKTGVALKFIIKAK